MNNAYRKSLAIMAFAFPEKLKEPKDLFDAKAKKNHIYPFIDRDDISNKRIHHL